MLLGATNTTQTQSLAQRIQHIITSAFGYKVLPRFKRGAACRQGKYPLGNILNAAFQIISITFAAVLLPLPSDRMVVQPLLEPSAKPF